MFCGSSQVNTRNLVAAAVGMTDQQFNKGIYSDTAGPDGIRTYTPSFGNDIQGPGTSGDAIGDVIVDAGASITTTTPASSTQGGGYTLLLGREVRNAGSIQTSGGQTMLAAGDSFVIRRGHGTDENTRATTHGNEIAVNVNSDSGAGSLSNTGLIIARTGDITMAGHAVTQGGVAVATTSVNARGTIHLLNSASDATGSITMSPGSVTSITVDPSGDTAFDAQRDALFGQGGTPDGLETGASQAFDNLSQMQDRPDLSRVEITQRGHSRFPRSVADAGDRRPDRCVRPALFRRKRQRD